MSTFDLRKYFIKSVLLHEMSFFFIETTVSDELENDLHQFRIFSFAEMGESESKLGLESHFVKDSDSKIE